MLSRLISSSVRGRVVVLALCGLLVAYGFRTARTAPLDVFPEFAPPKVEVQTEAPGLSTDEVEALVSVPLENALNGKALPWLVNPDIPHQSVYTKDAAEITVQLMLREVSLTNSGANAYQVWNYGGTTVPSIRSWFGEISALTGKPLKIQLYSRFMVSFLALFMPIMREVKEMLYLYENTILLDHMGDTTRGVRDPALDSLKVIVEEVQTSVDIRDQRSPRRRYHTRELRRFLA